MPAPTTTAPASTSPSSTATTSFPRLPWLAILVCVVLQQVASFVWFAGLFGDLWVEAQDFPFDYRAAHEGVWVAPLVMAIGNAAGAALLALIVQLARCPFGQRPLVRGIAWALMLFLCVALPLDAMRTLFAFRDPLVLAIDAGQSLLTWLVAGIVIGWAIQRRERSSGGQVAHNVAGGTR